MPLSFEIFIKIFYKTNKIIIYWTRYIVMILFCCSKPKCDDV